MAQLDFDSEEALSKEYIMCGWLWEERNIKEMQSEFRGISLHTSFLNRESTSFKVNNKLREFNLEGIPVNFYHSYQPFEVLLTPNFYDFCKTKSNHYGIFISKNAIASFYSFLDDSEELHQRVKNLISGILMLSQKDLERRIIEDTNIWNQRF